jgi:hypothetical protein
MPTPRVVSAETMRAVSRAWRGWRSVEGAEAKPARISSRLVKDFDPGRDSVWWRGAVTTGHEKLSGGWE